MSEQVNDPELLAAFFEESGDSIATVANLFIDLEQRPGDLELVQAIFRPVHSLKGNSAFFGLLALKRLAHEMETVLDLVRKGKLVVTGEIITTLLAGLDELRAIIERVRGGGAEIADQAAYDALVERQRAAAGGAAADGDGLVQAVAHVETFLTQHGPGLDGAVRSAIAVLVQRARKELGLGTQSQPVAKATVDQRLGELRSLVAASFTSEPEAAAVERMGVLVAALPGIAADERGRQITADLLDAWRTCIGAAGYNEILRDFLASQVEVLATLAGFQLVEQPTLVAAPPSGAIEAKTDRVGRHDGPDDTKREVQSDVHRRDDKADKAKAEGKSIRVAEARIDTFLSHVGELLVVGDMFHHLLTRVRQQGAAHKLVRDFRRANDTFAQLSTKLQQSIMSIRKVPIRSQLAKVPRIVRDVAQAKGKEIAVEIRGDDVEIDKSLIELIDAPLTHMSRNAADHGIETPERRVAAGKDRTGRVVISVEETSRAVVLSVSDDGAGLNLERIRAKGESLGLIRPGAEMTEKDLINLIFASGLSTAEVVSDVSGRGVGMDVVKRMIDEAGGSIQISTKPGLGTEFRLSLPKGVTTQIVPAFLVRAGDNLVALPLERVRETFLKRGVNIATLPGGPDGMPAGHILLRHDETLPLVSLAGVLGITSTADEPTVVTLDCSGRHLAVAVREVLGVRKIVVRPLDGLPEADGLYLGGAMTGDGAVVLIVNPDALLTTEVQRAG